MTAARANGTMTTMKAISPVSDETGSRQRTGSP